MVEENRYCSVCCGAPLHYLVDLVYDDQGIPILGLCIQCGEVSALQLDTFQEDLNYLEYQEVGKSKGG